MTTTTEPRDCIHGRNSCDVCQWLGGYPVGRRETTTEGEPLAACPFCGKQPSTAEWVDVFRIDCLSEECGVNCEVREKTRVEAAAIWNRRRPPTIGHTAGETAAREAALEEAARACDAMHDLFAQDERGKGINRGAAVCAERIRALASQPSPGAGLGQHSCVCPFPRTACPECTHMCPACRDAERATPQGSPLPAVPGGDSGVPGGDASKAGGDTRTSGRVCGYAFADGSRCNRLAADRHPHPRIPQRDPVFMPLAPGVVRYNGGTRCDMEVGPCSCGATHAPQSDPKGET